MSYRTAIVCTNGHMLTDSSENPSSDISREPHCKICGAQNIYQCPNCQNNIQGYLKRPGVLRSTKERLPTPRYCLKCGNPYPWTQDALDAAAELFELDTKLSNTEKEEILKVLPELLTSSPTAKTEVAIVKADSIIHKMSDMTKGALKDVIVSIAAEAVSKKLFP